MGKENPSDEQSATPGQRAKKMLVKLVVMALLVYCGLCLAACIFQRSIIYPLSKDVDRTPAQMRWDFEDLFLEVGEYKTHAWFIPAPIEARGTILFSHGNAGNISNRLESCGTFRSLGFNVLVYDYGGYGRSTGSPSEQRLYADIRAAWAHLIQTRGLDPRNIILFGRSLGGGPTAQLAIEVEPAGVILESTFMSTPAMAKGVLPGFPGSLLLFDKFNTVGKVADITAPLLVAHSPDDDIVPYHHGKTNFERATEPKTFFEMRGDHNSGYYFMGDDYAQEIDRFLTSVLED